MNDSGILGLCLLGALLGASTSCVFGEKCSEKHPETPSSGAELLSAQVEAELSRLLDDFHDAAASADEERYFAHFAPDAVFVGTDATERWTLDEFRAYAHPHFEAGRGWSYRASSRNITVAPGGDVAWFDERLANAKYGELRGSGVWSRHAAGWRLRQYVLSFAVPNELAVDFAERVRAAR